MAYLDKEFNQFYEKIKIKKEADDLRNKRDKLKEDIEKYLPDELGNLGIDVKKTDFEFFNQGSYAINTTICNDDGPIDLDYAIIVPIDTNAYKDIPKIKKAVKNSLTHVTSRTVDIKEPCITVSYHQNGKETIHIDFPIYSVDGDNKYLARGREFSDEDHYCWESADPKGLLKYFKDFLDNNAQLRRTVRFVKKWKQEQYKNSNNDNEIPPSVALTILTCQNYIEKDHDIHTIYETLKAIKDKFIVSFDSQGNIDSAVINCNLPVTPYSDVFYKMRNSSNHMITFYKRISKAVANLNTAISLEDEHEAGVYIQKVFGGTFEIPEKQAKNTAAKYGRESSFG